MLGGCSTRFFSPLRIVFQRVLANEIHVVEKVPRAEIRVHVDFRHHRLEIHWLFYYHVIVWDFLCVDGFCEHEESAKDKQTLGKG